jgi:pimeloyl-ACP methyl ester carboxylesterase
MQPARAAQFVFLAALCTGSAAAGTLSEVTFADYSPLSRNLELARRMLTPLTAAQLPQILASKGSKMAEQPVELAQEKFALYVPSSAPPARGYGLIVFVPPWNGVKVPDDWAPVLDQYGIVFVSAARSGNDATALGRREPLALLAERNVAKRYPIDPMRVYVAGFSGGSRIAMRLALGYPDVFRGAILNSGGDPIGDAIVPLPPRDLFLQFQNSSRLVYLTGGRDTFVLNAAAASRRSMRDWCQFNVEDIVSQSAGHETIDGSALSRALVALSVPPESNAGQLQSCRSNIESELAAQVRQVESLIASGQREAAWSLLHDLDAHFGGLAAPKSLELARTLEAN